MQILLAISLLFGVSRAFGYAFFNYASLHILTDGWLQRAKAVYHITSCAYVFYQSSLVVENCFLRSSIKGQLSPNASRLFTSLDRITEQHSFLVPFICLLVAWLPIYLGNMPGLFMGDTAGQIKVWIGIPDSDWSLYLNSITLIDPNVLLVRHHPIMHSALLGSFYCFGRDILGDPNYGLAIFTFLQMLLHVSAYSYGFSTLGKERVSIVWRSVIFVLVASSSLLHTFAILLTKDALFAPMLLIFCICSYRAIGERSLTRSRAFLLLTGALGMTAFRMGAALFSVAGLVAAALVCDEKHRKLLVGFAGLVFCSYLLMTRAVYPALHITPGSPREAQCVPFQIVGRYVHSYSDEVTAEEEAAIDAVLEYNSIASLYNPENADGIKATYKRTATTSDLVEFYKTLLSFVKKHPGTAISAFLNQTYGYSYGGSRQEIGGQYNLLGNSLPQFEMNEEILGVRRLGPMWLQRIGTLAYCWYRISIRFWLTALPWSASSLFWSYLLLCLMHYRHKLSRAFVPCLVVAGLIICVCFIGPINGNHYIRYIYPIACILPFFVPLALHSIREQQALTAPMEEIRA